MIIDCISDLHGHYPQLEGGDLLIVAGDLTATDSVEDYNDFSDWLCIQKYRSKIFIGGNHDNHLQKTPILYTGVLGCDYLCDSGTEFEYEEEETKWGMRSIKKCLKIWGSPWTLKFKGENPKAMAFTCDTEEELAEKFAMIPDDIDILVTHSPAQGALDEIEYYSIGQIVNVGSESLIKPMIKSGCRLHIFGHIHEGYGKFYNPINGITYINASYVNERYEPVNKPIRIIL